VDQRGDEKRVPGVVVVVVGSLMAVVTVSLRAVSVIMMDAVLIIPLGSLQLVSHHSSMFDLRLLLPRSIVSAGVC